MSKRYVLSPFTYFKAIGFEYQTHNSIPAFELRVLFFTPLDPLDSRKK